MTSTERALRELMACLDVTSVAMTPDTGRTVEAIRVARSLLSSPPSPPAGTPSSKEPSNG